MYVGSSFRVNERIQNHLHDYCVQQWDLHEAMRKHGFDVFIVDVIENGKQAHLEYDWIDFFVKKTDFRVCNVKRNLLNADWHRIEKKEVVQQCQQLLCITC